MRQVGKAELEWVLVMALQRMGAGVHRQLLSRERDKAALAQAMLARQLAADLGRFEILTGAPAPQNDQTFAQPIAYLLGEPTSSGLPPMGGE